MPKDDTSSKGGSGSASASASHPPPLRRGDACLYCRRRRIRCNAAKPACQNCIHLKRECQYDVGKPVSRARQFEDRIAELEAFIRANGGDPETLSSISPPAAASTGPSRSTSTDAPTSINPEILGSFNASGLFPPTPVTGQSTTPEYDWNTIDPNFFSLINQLQDASTSGHSNPFSLPHIPVRNQEALQSHLSQIPTQLDSVVQRVPAPPIHAPAPPIAVIGQGTDDVIITSRTPLALRLQTADDTQPPILTGGFSFGAEPQSRYPALQPMSPPLRAHFGSTNVPVGGWWDPNDLPPEARDQLLDLFFNSLKLFKIFHVPRFMARQVPSDALV